MHSLSTSFVLGYHGCSKATAEAVLSGEKFKPSENDHDWLGTGVYFWEANPSRGLHYYRESQRRQKRDGDDATVVGAVINLGYCFDLLSLKAAETLAQNYSDMVELLAKVGADIPENQVGSDKVKRYLDCAVINFMHSSRDEEGLQPFDCVRAAFFEGKAAFPGSGFLEKTHIQIAVRNDQMIKGVFRVPPADLDL